jgi:hypothetical protein
MLDDSHLCSVFRMMSRDMPELPCDAELLDCADTRIAGSLHQEILFGAESK